MSISINTLAAKKCKSCEGNVPPLSTLEIEEMLYQLDGWELFDGLIVKTYNFKNYYEVMAFVNTVAWISHREDHHPDIALGYNKCRVEYITHSAGGLSENDFICAAKIDVLFKV